VSEAAESGAIALLLDEVDAVIHHPFRTVVFRALSELRPEVTIIVAGMAEPDELWGSSEPGPFTADRRIVLRDFTLEQLQPAAALLKCSNSASVLQRVHYWTAGHPFLTMSVLNQVEANGGDVDPTVIDQAVKKLFFDKPAEHSSNLHFIQTQLSDGPRELYRRVLHGEQIPPGDLQAAKRLLLSGIVVEHQGFLRVRNRIYETWFNDQRLAEMERPGPFQSELE
jgi:hypothetical protein